MNRAKTKKWLEAKAYSYEGDDWGDYDETDEYGVESAPPAQKPTGLRQQGQSIEQQQQASAGRSFTNPVGMSGQDPHRRESFERGDERRTFSAGTQPPQGYGEFPQNQYSQQPRGAGGAPLHVRTDTASMPHQRGDSVPTSSSRYPSTNQSAVSDALSSVDYQHRRDFSPSAVPAPLQSRTPQPGTPQSAARDTPTAQFPPRKSSLSQPNSPTSQTAPSATEAPPRQQTPTTSAKPLPFIRPADIYKRMEEERARERASMESGRPSMDSILRPGEEAHSATPRERTSMDSLPRRTSLESVKEEGGTSTPNSQLRAKPLATVTERKSEYGMPAGAEEAQHAPPASQPAPPVAAPSPPPTIAATSGPLELPQFSQDSDFEKDFWGSTPDPAIEHPTTQTHQQADSGLQHTPSLGFRSVVEQAFDRPDEHRPVLETSMSKQNSLRSPATTETDMSRSNTNSTSGISPIMSRVPSVGAAAAAKANSTEGMPIDHSQTPVIVEEPDESSRPSSRMIQRKPSPSHSRDPSTGSANYIPGYRRDLSTPPSRGSPARSPAIEAQKEFPEPAVGQFATAHQEPSTLSSPETREADFAESVSRGLLRPGSRDSPKAAEGMKDYQREFLDAHKGPMPTVDTSVGNRPESPAKSRSQSPSKTRVQELAGRFDDFAESNSRRNSSHSMSSRGSWKQDGEGLSLPDQRPSIESQPSFRPKLPGQWESFATTRADSTPNESDAEREFHSDERNPIAHREVVVPDQDPADAEIDLTPTTNKHHLPAREMNDESPSFTSNPMAALAAAGTAMGEALQASVGMGSPEHEDSDSDDWDADPVADQAAAELGPDHLSPTKRETGNIFARPLGPDRMESNVSSIPPTPPAKDIKDSQPSHPSETESEDMPPPPPPLKGTRNVSGGASIGESPLASTPPRPADLPQLRTNTGLSTDSTADDEESDRLRKDIYRTLSPVKDSPNASQNAGLEVPGQASGKRESDILPSEYDSYWEGARPDGTRYSQMPGEVQVGPHTRPDNIPEEPSPVPSETFKRPGLLDKRFSWERSRDSRDFAEIMDNSGPSETAGGQRAVPEISAPVNEAPTLASGTMTSQAQPGRGASASPPSGLHVINNTGLEEAIDVPPRLATPQPQHDDDSSKEVTPLAGEPLVEQTPMPVEEKDFAAMDIPEPVSPSTGQKPRLLPFREIAAIPNPAERIKSFNSTREQFATMDTGLQGWLTATMAAHPEHNSLLTQKFTPSPRPTSGPSARMGHKPSPSISKFTSMLSPTSPEQAKNPGQGSSPSSGPSASSSGPRPSIAAGSKVGKDLLNNAGALGGKATTIGKGLFAKGKSRFRGSGGGDKVE